MSDDVVDGLQAHRMQRLDVGLEGQHLVHRERVVHRLVPVGAVPSGRVKRGRSEDQPLVLHDRLPIGPPLGSDAFHQPPL